MKLKDDKVFISAVNNEQTFDKLRKNWIYNCLSVYVVWKKILEAIQNSYRNATKKTKAGQTGMSI